MERRRGHGFTGVIADGGQVLRRGGLPIGDGRAGVVDGLAKRDRAIQQARPLPVRQL
jgi:hypothetical protein